MKNIPNNQILPGANIHQVDLESIAAELQGKKIESIVFFRAMKFFQWSMICRHRTRQYNIS